MYLIGVVVFLVLMVGIAMISGAPLAFVDLPSLLVVLALTLSIMIASGLLADFFKGFKLMGQKVNPFSAIELKRIRQANRLAICALLISGAVGFVVGVIAMLSSLSDAAALGPNIAMAMLTMLYALLFVLVVLPVNAKVRAILSTME